MTYKFYYFTKNSNYSLPFEVKASNIHEEKNRKKA